MTSKTQNFIEKARKVHGDKYDYSKVEYVNSHTKICIICPEHGEFWQTPNNHLCGKGCNECGKRIVSLKKSSNTDDFITKAKKVHGNKYDYSNVVYVKNNEKIKIICPIHGGFEQTPLTHLSGCGCPKCFGKNKNNLDFIEQSKKIHGDKYDYSKVIYKGVDYVVKIICPIHGEFEQTPRNHLNGHGCQKCAYNKISNVLSYTNEIFAEKANVVHNNKYHYDKVNYNNSKDKVIITCPEHGDFIISPDKHLQGQACPKCANIISKNENEIFNFIICNELSVKQRVRDVIPPYELDIYITDKKIAIEYNGLLWHSERYNKDKNYHLNKTLECERQGIRLIHIFEDEYIFHKEIVLSKIKQFLGQNGQLEKISARKTIVKEITKIDAESFLNKNHIQGFVTSTVYFGCFNKTDNELVAVMTFKRERNDCNRWELTRFATDISKHCIGVGGKLFSNFVKVYNPSYVKSFADRRWTLDKDNNLYTKLGFKLDKILKPDYRYVVKNERIHKFNFRKDKILRHYPNNGLTSDMTEREMTDKLGFYRIWDCGLFKYVWRKKQC